MSLDDEYSTGYFDLIKFNLFIPVISGSNRLNNKLNFMQKTCYFYYNLKVNHVLQIKFILVARLL